MAKPKLGSGTRFKALAKKTSPAIAAMIGMKKYGKAKMMKMAQMGKKKK